MIPRFLVPIYKRLQTKGDEGQLTFTYVELKHKRVDIQPTSLSPVQMQLFGLGTTASGAQKMFFWNDDMIQELMRVTHAGKTYDIRNISVWSKHSEATLIPVQGI